MNQPLKPWYKEPWPWVAIAIPGAAVIMGITTLILALNNPDPVIVSDQDYRELSSGLKAQQAQAPDTASEEAEPPPEPDDGES
jgi:hypothetical protein